MTAEALVFHRPHMALQSPPPLPSGASNDEINSRVVRPEDDLYALENVGVIL